MEANQRFSICLLGYIIHQKVLYYRSGKLHCSVYSIYNSSRAVVYIKSSWSSRDRLRAFRFSSRLWGRGGVLPLRNRTARALIFWQRSNTCKCNRSKKIQINLLQKSQMLKETRLKMLFLFLTDEASISATPSQPLPPPCNKSQYLTASFSSSNTCNTSKIIYPLIRFDKK